MLYNAALVLEGGAMRGQYSTGITDAFLRHHIEFRAVVGVSAGALCGANYVSKQYGRMVHVNTHYRHDPDYISARRLLKREGILNLDFLFEDHGWDWRNYDERAYERSASDFTIVATSLETGRAITFTNPRGQDFVNAIKASSSMPFVSAPQETTAGPCLDGGVADSIPYDVAQAQGYDKLVVVRTRPRDYQKDPTPTLLARLYRRHFADYPAFAQAGIDRPLVYNRQVQALNALEEAGRAFVFAPKKAIKVHRLEGNVKKLAALYRLGQDTAEQLLPAMAAYLSK